MIRGLYDHRLSSIVVKDEVMASYNDHVQSRVKHTAWSLSTCGSSWYKSKEGKVVVAAPWSASKASINVLRRSLTWGS